MAEEDAGLQSSRRSNSGCSTGVRATALEPLRGVGDSDNVYVTIGIGSGYLRHDRGAR